MTYRDTLKKHYDDPICYGTSTEAWMAIAANSQLTDSRVMSLLAERDALRAELERVRGEKDKLGAKYDAVKDVLLFHLGCHKNFPAHGSARHMALLEQLRQSKDTGVLINRNVLPECDCDVCVKARAALEVMA